MLLLAQSYEKSGGQDKANLRYQKIVESYPGTEAADTAKEALDAQQGGGTQEENTQDQDDGTADGSGDDDGTASAGADDGGGTDDTIDIEE